MLGNKSDKNRSTLKDKVASIVITLESIILVIMVIALVGAINDTRIDEVHNAQQLLKTAEREDFANLLVYVASNRAQGVEGPEYNEVYAIADYYYDCIVYKGCVAAKDEVKSKECYDSMQKDIVQMGELSYIAEDINTLLLIE